MGLDLVLYKNVTDLTPVEKRGRYFFKRDDLYQPFEVPLNGGKVRQALSCFQSNRKRIRGYHAGVVCTVSSVHSPQGYLIARCAHSLGLKTIIGVGTSRPEDVAERYPSFQRAVALGAEIRNLAKIGYNSVLQSRLDALAKTHKWFRVGFGISSDLTANARQVRNLPKLNNLVIPCGSGVMSSAILQGLAGLPRERRPNNVYVVQIAGIDRRKVIHNRVSYHFIADRTYPYATRVPVTYEGLELDNLYESKAFHWLLREQLQGSTCFWVIGNFNTLRG